MQDYYKIPEEKVPYDYKADKNYNFYLTEDEVKELEKLRNKSVMKEFNTTSKFVRYIIKNTYLYLNNKERGLSNDIEKALNKAYYKDIDKKFKEKLQPGNKEYDLFLEMVRIQVFKSFRDPFDGIKNNDNDIRIPFRLSGEDAEDVRKIIGGNNKYMTNPEFLQGFVRYFLSSSYNTKNIILSYPNILKLERAIKDRRYILIHNKKYKPYLITTDCDALYRHVVLCFDENYTLKPIGLRVFVESNKVEETELLFEFEAQERKIIKAFEALNTITASYKIVEENDKNIDALNWMIKKSPRIKFHKVENGKTIIEFDYQLNSNIIRKLDEAFQKGSINYLCYSSEYNEFVKLNNNHKL